MVTIKGTVREKKTNFEGTFGVFTSKELAPFIGKEVNIRVEEINSVQVN